MRWLVPFLLLTTSVAAAPVCDGVTDDGPAIQAMIGLAPDGGEVSIPATSAGCLIATTVVINKPLTIDGDGTAKLLVPDTTAFHVTAAHVTISDLYFVGNRSAYAGNGAVWAENAPALTMKNIRAELLNAFVTVHGGFFHQFQSIRLRNMVRAGFLFDGYGGNNGVEAIIDGLEYDTDVASYGGPVSYAQPTGALIWVLDFDGVVLSNFDLIHAGQIAAFYVNPQSRRSGDHLIGLGYFDSTQGACIKIMPEGAARADRIFIKGTWMATCNRGLWLTGSSQINGIYADGALFYNNQNEGYRYDNTYSGGVTSSVRNSHFTSNNVSASGKSDLYLKGGAAAFFHVEHNIFNNDLGITTSPKNNVEVVAPVGGARIHFNDFAYSNTSGSKVSGIGGSVVATMNVP